MFQDRKGKWVGRWKFKLETRYVGYFNTKKEALDAVEADKRKMRGEFHCTRTKPSKPAREAKAGANWADTH